MKNLTSARRLCFLGCRTRMINSLRMNSSPKNDELEVSIFGPGYGECALLHIGNGEWVIVDSCTDRKTKNPAALDYLDNIGVCKDNVSLIVATHWHDDHIRGLGSIVTECTKAKFVCSMAIRSEEFSKLVELYKHKYLGTSFTGVSEFISIFNTLQERETSPKFAISERKIWESNSTATCSAYSLSPSDLEISNSLASIASLIPQEGVFPRTVRSPNKNHSAVVLWFKLGEDNVLLGSDLEERGIPGAGWKAIVEGNMVRQEKASIYKVAHHGSPTGYYQHVWSEMLHENPWALLTPFSRGGKPIPSNEDVDIINSHTDRAYITFPAQKHLKRKIKDPLVKKIISKHTLKMRYAEKPCSQIRLRKMVSSSDSGDWQLTLNGDACKL